MSEHLTYALIEDARGTTKLYVTLPAMAFTDDVALTHVNIDRAEKGLEPLSLYGVVLFHMNDVLVSAGHRPVGMEDVVFVLGEET